MATPPLPNLVVALRRAGYAPDRANASLSFVRPLSPAGRYPQFHVYVDDPPRFGEPPRPLRLTLHLDQRAPTYGRQSVHGGEYGGAVVEQEGARLRSALEAGTA